MKICFRADASVEIGSGHIMRCLTLARALRERGAMCRFVARAHPGHLAQKIAAEGFSVLLLPAPEGSGVTPSPAHEAWAGVGWQQDADETRMALENDRQDWLVLDHYAFDALWQTAMRPSVERLMVIDDLADRSHDCDLLLDQNLGREGRDYDGLISDDTKRLIGPSYALLRPEFAQARAESLASRSARTGLGHILISMGGTDAMNATGQILEVLSRAGLPKSTTVTIVMGSTAPCYEDVRKQAENLPFDAVVRANVKDMARLMTQADLAIGAAGGSAWERCCLGLPTLVLVQAENQRPGARALDKVGAGLLLGEIGDDGWKTRLTEFIHRGDLQATLDHMSHLARSITDGRGAERAANEILGGYT